MKIYANDRNNIERQLHRYIDTDIWVKLDAGGWTRWSPKTRYYMKVLDIWNRDDETFVSGYILKAMDIQRIEDGDIGCSDKLLHEIKWPAKYAQRESIPISWISEIYHMAYTSEELLETIEDAKIADRRKWDQSL